MADSWHVPSELKFHDNLSVSPTGCCIGWALLILGGLFAVDVEAEEPTTVANNKGTLVSQKEALGQLNSLIGGWRGTGQPRRGSADGSWFETADWVWGFQKETVSLKYELKEGKLFKSAKLEYDPTEKQFVLTATLPDDKSRKYTGVFDKDKLVLTSMADERQEEHRLTLTLLNDKRTLVLHEKRKQGQETYLRVAEVGYTRQGTHLADSGVQGRECIVTGGTGTIAVQYKGKTYYVCCTGCQQAFQDDPEGILAEVAAKKEKSLERK